MSTYIIGDIQGCFKTLTALLQKCTFSPKQDHIWIAGDLVNRGDHSLKSLRWGKALDRDSRMVLGNHEIHLIAAYFGIRTLRKSDTVEEILLASDVRDLISWLRERKLVHRSGENILVHAGFSPKWDLAHAVDLSARIESLLQGKLCEEFLRFCFTKAASPLKSDWRELADGLQTMTHIRACKKDGTLNTEYSGSLETIPAHYHPWYKLSHPSIAEKQVFFGHWAAHGYKRAASFTCLDSGCVWGGQLTAFRLDDGKVFQQKSVEDRRVVSNVPI